MSSRSVILLLVTMLFVTVGLSAHTLAYVDLGTGSYVLQMVVAGLFGMIFSVKSLWAKVRGFFPGSDRSGKP